MKRLILALLLITLSTLPVYAQTLAPVTWIHTNTSTEVYVASYWWQQFPDRADADGRHLAFVVPVSVWDGWGAAKRQALRGNIDKLLNGTVRVTRANLATWKGLLEAAGITVDLVLPGEMPAIGAKLYVIVCAKGERAAARLRELGLEPENE